MATKDTTIRRLTFLSIALLLASVTLAASGDDVRAQMDLPITPIDAPSNFPLNAPMNSAPAEPQPPPQPTSPTVPPLSSQVEENTQASDAVLSLADARVYMLNLINRDRRLSGLNPVAIDPIATLAGQKHTDEMVQAGFISHWNQLGKKPDQRYTEAGGIHCDTENVALRTFRGGAPSTASDTKRTSFDGGGTYKLHGIQAFRMSDLERMQKAFMDEKAPKDGHRRCILDPAHNYVGIGLSLSSNGQENYRVAMAQEFTNIHGQYDPVQQMCTTGQAITISGRLNPGLEVYEIFFDWDPLPEPMNFAELDKTTSYVAGKKRMYRYWPPSVSQEGPTPLQVSQTPDGRQQFRCAILPKGWKPGIYYACIMVKPQGADYIQSFLASRRSIIVPSK